MQGMLNQNDKLWDIYLEPSKQPSLLVLSAIITLKQTKEELMQYLQAASPIQYAKPSKR